MNDQAGESPANNCNEFAAANNAGRFHNVHIAFIQPCVNPPATARQFDSHARHRGGIGIAAVAAAKSIKIANANGISRRDATILRLPERFSFKLNRLSGPAWPSFPRRQCRNPRTMLASRSGVLLAGPKNPSHQTAPI